MTITFKPYMRRDGSMMLYVNRSNGVSVGLSAERGFSPYGKGATAGQRNAMEAAWAVIRAHAVPFTGDLSAHAEGGFCAPRPVSPSITLVGTDCGRIGGMRVPGDGPYLVARFAGALHILRAGTYEEG